MLAASVIAGLVGAGPAVAADDPEPTPMATVAAVVTEVAPGPVPIPALPPSPIEEPTVVVTQDDAGNLDVSVRVLSPEESETAAESAELALISPPSEPDITDGVEPDTVVPRETTADDTSPDASGDPDPAGVNTNVSVRILSPGENGPVAQRTAGGGEGAAQAGVDPATGPEPAPVSAVPNSDAEDSPQYQDPNSRYQSGSETADEPWHWDWSLTIDCAGDVASATTQTGNPESRVWDWEWTWEWGCAETDEREPSHPDSTGRSPPAETGGNPSREPPLDRAGSSEGSDQAAPLPGDPWSWTWTLAFCGEKATIETGAGADTQLTWTWNWSWTWSCGAEATEPAVPPLTPPVVDAPIPSPAEPPSTNELERRLDSGQSAIEPPAAAVVVPAGWLRMVPQGFDPRAVWVALGVALPGVETPLEITIEIALEIAVPSAVLPALPAHPTAPQQETVPRKPPSGSERDQPSPLALPHAPPVHEAATTERGQRSRPAKHARPQVARAKPARDELAPLDLPVPAPASGPSSAGGIGSIALLGVATLVGIVVLTAPALGRRIRVARELSPRGHDEPPIDHPG